MFFLLVFAASMAFVASPVSAQSAPSVSSVTPSSGPLKGGQNVIIKGTDFTGTTAVAFGSTAATSFAVISSTQIVAELPDAAAAAKELITVTNGTGTNTTGASFEYKATTIKSISPAYASTAASSVVVINGSGFARAVAADVKFGAVAATAIWVVSDSQIIASSPTTGTSNGEVDVTVTRNSVASATSDKSKFLFTPGLPTIASLSDSGTDAAAAGTTLTITGTQLWAVKTVYFGSAKVTAAADITLTSDTSISVKIPTRSNGPVDVIVQNAAGLSVTNLGTNFNYYSTAAPKLNSVSKNVFDKDVTTGGGTFLVAGTGFTGLTTSDVTLKCTTDITPSAVTAVTDTSVIITIGGNVGSVAEACDLEIANAIDGTKVTTKTDAIRYV